MEQDFKDPKGQVRLLTADLSDPPLLSDTILNGYLNLYVGSEPQVQVWRAAADALDAMATSELLVSKKIRTQDLATDGPAVAAELRKKAADLRARADETENSGGSFFDFVPFGYFPGREGEELRL